MKQDIVKQGVQLAQDELREKSVQEVKKIVLKTLEKLKELETDKHKLDKQIKVLKMDIEDLKEGKLDRIVERQEKDEEAKKTSVVIIIKEKEVIREVERSPWYWPYRIMWQPQYVPHQPIVFGGTTIENMHYCGGDNAYTLTTGATSNGMTGLAMSGSWSTINCSVAKDAVVGAYNVGTEVVNLR